MSILMQLNLLVFWCFSGKPLTKQRNLKKMRQ